ncbi:beta strand repeat-containing protein [Bradyrhizobium sp. GCM10027634]|uniref:beta strand repeat-containing protein n=1 Tax=unclassified Bradyrhizobium TaxID=2631580 RepID=UPI00263B675A|nr:hypothetical protein [Bradyrhizobium sp. WYCCWR 12677]MDN5005273.1 hypothetical protein [Bradyrhizobium sp. WYCCWR 12677]
MAMVYVWDATTGQYDLVDDGSFTYTVSTEGAFSVTTDQSDYAPLSTATFTVNGVNAGDVLTFDVIDLNGLPISGTNQPWTIVASANGSLQTTWNVGADALDQAFLLTVIDQTTGQIVTANFTDALTPVNATSSDLTWNPVSFSFDNGVTFLTENPKSVTGTGVFPAFVQIQASPKEDGVEQGFNTNFRPAVEDTQNPLIHNHAIVLSDINTETDSGVTYRVFHLDLNEPNDGTQPQITLDALKLYAAGVNNLSDYNGTLVGGTELFNMDGGADGKTGGATDVDVSVQLTDWTSGSGHGDYKVLIPETYFAGVSNNSFIYLYSQFSGADSGFEEWALGLAPSTGPTPQASISLVKDTVCPDDITHSVANGTLLTGSGVEWTYSVTNTGNADLTNIVVTDDGGNGVFGDAGDPTVTAVTLGGFNVGDTNQDGLLNPGETWEYSAIGTATEGRYQNFAHVTAAAVDPTVQNPNPSGDDTSAYTGVTVTDTSITIEKDVSVDGGTTWFDANDPTGPTLLAGHGDPQYRFIITNNSDVALPVHLVDSTLGIDLSNISVTAGGSTTISTIGGNPITSAWTAGQNTNTADVSSTFTDDCGNTASPAASDSANYFGATPGVSIEKDIVCPEGTVLNADTTVNLLDNKAGTVTYKIIVKNTGNVALANPTVTDPTLGTLPTPTQTGGSGSNTDNTLDVGETWTYIVTALWAMGGPHTNTADVSVSFKDGAGNTFTEDPSDSASYYGLNPHITLNKLTNGSDGPSLLQGQAITWTYDVNNDGNVALSNVSVTDNPAQTITAVMSGLYNSGDTNDNGVLDPGETWHFIATGVAIGGSYSNTATATTNSVTDDCGDSVTPTATDGSSYTGLAQAQDGLTKGFWATHLTLWDVVTTDNSGATDINPTPQYDWNKSGAISLSAVVKTGPTSGLGAVSGSNNGGGDSGLLMGDLNHDGLVDTGDASHTVPGTPPTVVTDVLFFDLASAQTLANSSVSGDARVILGSQAVAAQLNEYKDYVLYNHDTSPNGLISEAVRWLQGDTTFAMSANGHSKVNFTAANDLTSPSVQTIINDAAGTDYTISGGAITFKSTALSSSDASWNKFVSMFSESAAGYHPLTGNGTVDATQYTVTADGEGLKNALAAYNHGLVNSTAGFVTSQDGSLIGWQDSSTGTPYDVHANTVDAFWAILEDQNLLFAATGGAHGMQIIGVSHA